MQVVDATRAGHKKGVPEQISGTPNWSRRAESNRRPADYESAALPTELRRPKIKKPFKGSGFNVQGYFASLILLVSEFVIEAFSPIISLLQHFGIE